MTDKEHILEMLRGKGRQRGKAEAMLEQETETRLSEAIDEINAARARSEITAGEIARLKVETRSVLEQIEAKLKQHVA